MIQDTIRTLLKPILEEAIVEAYKQGSEDTIRRFGFVYDAVAQTAKADVMAEHGAIDIEELSEELDPEVFEEVWNGR
jgi:hypothetical protein